MSLHQKLGDFSLELVRFPNLAKRLDVLFLQDWDVEESKRLEKVNALLLELVLEFPVPCFLLGAVHEFISMVLDRGCLSSYSFSQFEFWLNHFSGVDDEVNYLARGKIMGKYIPRETYQVLFPIGMGKRYFGSHYVTAHNSPDLDTTIASFWGWVDAFAARVGQGLHIWNVPGGPPDSQAEVKFLFKDLIGGKCFDYFAKTRTSLALTAIDLLTQQGVVKKNLTESSEKIEYDKNSSAIILVDDEGYYLGDWRQLDVEGVRKVTAFLHNCMRSFASCFQRKFTVFFSEEKVSKAGLVSLIQEMFCLRLIDLEPVRDLTEKQKKRVETYLVKVLGVSSGWNSTFESFWDSMGQLSLGAFGEFRQVLDDVLHSSLFSSDGSLIESRSGIFHALESVVSALENAIFSLRAYVDQLGVAFSIKKDVFGFPPQVVSHRAEVEEIRSKVGPHAYLSVLAPENEVESRERAIGIIRSVDLFKPLLGTVSLRDFCNRDETKIPAYFEVISVIDHHKTVLSTASAPVAFIADAQSANALVAEMAFSMHDKYSTSGVSSSEVEGLFKAYQTSTKKPSDGRVLQRLLQKQMILEKQENYFVDTQREILEYLQYLYAILDDTDLLSKVSYRDVVCVANLLNRLKSLSLKKEVEIISFDDLVLDSQFATKAAKRILQNEDMYSLYKKIYAAKESAVEEGIQACVRDLPSSIFSDTKVQNGCSRVGQSKFFIKNFPSYFSFAEEIRLSWFQKAKKYYQEHLDCTLHMHMISTVPSAEEVYQGNEGGSKHKDELWIWIPKEEQSIERLQSFLSVFRASSPLIGEEMEVEFLGDDSEWLEQVFHESFMPFVKKGLSADTKMSAPIAILRYRAGLLNSRKAMISPCLPKMVS